MPISQMTRPNGIMTTWSYEANRNLVTQVQNGTISTYGYVNDAIGRRTSMSRSGSAYATSDVISYTYNDRSELTGAQSSVDTTYSYSYAYDPIGNRITANEAGVPWTYTTNNLNQYVSATENNTQLSFAYDLDGSMTYRPVDATSGWTQVWNGENRMVETYKGTDRLTFKYDYMGRRVEKCVYSGNTLASRTLFVYDGFKCVEELDGLNSNAVLMRHTWQTFDVGLDVILATTDANSTSFFLPDANKNVMQKTDVNGIIKENYAYAPFGQALCAATPRIGFSSELNDVITWMVYYNYRYFNPRLGRWHNYDPIIQTLNLYRFIDNNMLSSFDSLGLFGDGREAKRRELRKKIIPENIAIPSSPLFPGGGWGIGTRHLTPKEIEDLVEHLPLGHSDFPGNDLFDYTIEDHDPNTEPVHHPENHFQDPIDALNDVRKATANCKKEDFERAMHRLQDNWTHYAKGFRSTWFHGWHPKHWIYGHGGALTFPDNDHAAWQVAAKVTQTRVIIWNQNCCQDKSGKWVKKSTGCCAK